jgi:hypothetical protein
MRTRDVEQELELEGEFEGELEGELEGEMEGEFEAEGEFESEFEGELELEGEFEGEYELETEFEGELESEYESELEGEFEGEYEEEQLFGTIARGLGSIISGAGEFEEEFEGEYESEEFFRRIGGFLRRAAPVLRRIAQVAAPIVGTAVGGPAGGLIGRGLAQALREEELEYEEEFEFEGEATGRSRATAEMMAAAAARSPSVAEAEAFVGAASVQILSPRDRRALRALLPHLVHGAAVLTRILIRHPVTRPAVRTVPTIVQRTAANLRRRVDAGQPVNRRVAGAVMARQTRQVLGQPQTVARIVSRNVQATRQVARPVAPTGLVSARRRTTGYVPGYPRRRYGPRYRRPVAPAATRRGVVVAQMPSGRLMPARLVPIRQARVVPPRAAAGVRRPVR